LSPVRPTKWDTANHSLTLRITAQTGHIQVEPVRVRALQVHVRAVPHAQAGQRFAVNLAGIKLLLQA
jgi:hypothetical protein